jgi:protein transport protein SEC31
LSWCAQDSDLLLSCGKDSRSICWNPQTGDSYGEFSVVTNWTFQTRWNPRNPTILATASFDGKIRVQSIQTTISADANFETHSHTMDDKDFFNIAQGNSRGHNFVLPKAPKWMERPCGAAFEFGGKILSFSLAPKTDPLRHSTIRISRFAVDVEVSAYTEAFERALSTENLRNICKFKAENATATSETSDWEIIETLTLDNPRKELISHLGFPSTDEATKETMDTAKSEQFSPINEKSSTETNNSLSAFFDNVSGAGNFLSDLEASQSTKTNNPFHIYSGSETKAQQKITRALLLGQFDKALDISLLEGKLSDAFMIAICGGETCIAKVQKAYFNQTSEGPNYLRLLASIVNKNLWDVVYNADISCWKEVMTVLCTYAGAEEFSDLCEALGDRLESQMEITDAAEAVRKDAAFCYLAGSKLEKVITMWISDMEKLNDSAQNSFSIRSNYSLYARSLQSFIEKVTIFREVVHFQDSEQLASSGWKLHNLYDKYIEYADMVSSYGHLHIAERYLAQVPEQYPTAAVARNRVKEALRRPVTVEVPSLRPQAAKIPPSMGTLNSQHGQQHAGDLSVSDSHNPFSRGTPGHGHNTIAQLNDGFYQPKGLESTAFHQRSYQTQKQIHLPGGVSQPPGTDLLNQNQKFIPPPPKPDGAPPSSNPSQPQAQATNNWNDTPESFFRPPTSRRATPGINAVTSADSQTNPNTIPRPSSGFQSKPVPPLAPPPKSLGGPPPRLNSPVPQSAQLPERPVSTIQGVYAPPQSTPGIEPIKQQSPALRGPSPYHTSPSPLPPSNRYTPTPAPHSATSRNPSSGSAMMSGPNRQGPLPSNPYTPQINLNQQQPNDPGRYTATPSIPSTASQTLRQLEPRLDSLKPLPHSSKPGLSQPPQPIISASGPPKYG